MPFWFVNLFMFCLKSWMRIAISEEFGIICFISFFGLVVLESLNNCTFDNYIVQVWCWVSDEVCLFWLQQTNLFSIFSSIVKYKHVYYNCEFHLKWNPLSAKIHSFYNSIAPLSDYTRFYNNIPLWVIVQSTISILIHNP